MHKYAQHAPPPPLSLSLFSISLLDLWALSLSLPPPLLHLLLCGRVEYLSHLNYFWHLKAHLMPGKYTTFPLNASKVVSTTIIPFVVMARNLIRTHVQVTKDNNII